ncbi:MAG: protoporphyrinogen oxidase [Planctomycetota bacterium]
MTRVAVVGAGLAGLAAAYELKRRGADVTVFESRSEPGGVVRSLLLDGCRFERGPNTVPAGARRFRELAVGHGLESALVGSSETAKSRWVWHAGRLVRVPLKPQQVLTSPLFSLRAKLTIASEPIRRWREPAGEEPSFGALLRERIGVEPTERLAAAFVRGIYAGDVDQLGAKSAFPRLWDGLGRHGSLIRFVRAAERAAREAELPGPKLGPGQLLGLAGGLDRLPRAMAAALDDRVQLGAPVAAITRKAGALQLRVGSDTHAFEHVVLATPAGATARLIGALAPPAVLEFLESIPHASLDVAHATVERAALPSVPEGFGYLVPPIESGRGAPPVLGTIYGANLFDDRAPKDTWCFSAFYAPNVLPPDPAERRTAVASHFAQAQGWSQPPALRSLLVDTWRDVIPQATVGFAERRARALTDLAHTAPDLVLAGTFTGGVAVEDVLQRGTRVAESLALARPELERP